MTNHDSQILGGRKGDPKKKYILGCGRGTLCGTSLFHLQLTASQLKNEDLENKKMQRGWSIYAP